MKTPLFDDKVQSTGVTELGIVSYNMESGERLSSPSSAPSSLHMASSSAGSSPAPPQMPSAKCSPAFSLAGSSPLSAENFPSELLRCTKSQGPFRQMSGDGSLKRPAKSNSFPLVSRPASRLYTSSEFGGLGSLGLSAFAAHPQFGTFPDWWWPSEAHLRGAAAFLPPLLGLHPAFASTIKSQDPAHSQPRTSVSVDMNGTVNGRRGPPPTGKSTMNSSSIPAKRNKEKTQANCCQKSIQDPGHQKTALQTKEKNPSKRPLETSSMSGSQSGSLSESSSDVEESSSDADDMEEEDNDDEEEDDQSNDSEDSDSTTEGCLKRKAKWLTQSTSDSKKKRLCIADENPTQDSHCDGAALTPLHRLQSSHPDDQPLSASPFLQSCRAAEEENQQHISVIQAIGTATSNSPFALSLRDVSPLASSSPANPKSFSNSPRHLPLTASPKHFSQVSSPKHSSVSSSPQPLGLYSPMKPLSPKSSPSPKFLPLSSTPKPPARSASQNPAHTQSSLVLSSNHTWPVDSLKESSGSLSDKNSFHFNSFKLRQAGHSKDSLKQVFSLQHPSQSCETNLFLGHHANGETHPEVQDAPLALITKHRIQSCTFNTKPLLAATSPSYPMPINLSTTTKEPSGSTASLPKSTSSSRSAHGSRKTKTPTSLSSGKTVSKTHSCSPVDLDKGSESDIHSSKDSESDSLDDFDEDEDDIEEEDSGTSLSESESNMDSDSDSSEDDIKEHGEMEAGSDVERFPLKVAKAPLSAHKSSSPLSASSSPLNLQVVKPASSPCGLLTPTGMTRLGALSNLSALSTSFTLAALPGPGKRRTVPDESVLRLPLEFGWRRETRIRTVAGRLQGEVAYFAPCGKKMRQYPDVMKYLLRNGIIEISRDNFSFSTKVKVGEFYGAREGAEGLQWVLLAEEEITPTIIAMDGRRSRRLKSDHQPTGDGTGSQQLKSHPLIIAENNFQDAKLLRKLEAQEIARQAAHIKLRRKLEKQAMVQAAKDARKRQAILAAEERRKKREQIKILKQQEKIKRIQQIRMEKELRAQQILEAKRRKKEEAANARILEAEKRNKEREMQRLQAVILKHQERERRRQHMMLMKAVETRKKAEEKERLKKEKDDERRLNKERKLELKRLEVEKAKELKKPNEDMCLADLKLLPELSRVPGLVLPGNTFSDCLMVLQFLHSFGKVLGLETNLYNLKLNDLQEGLLNIRGGLGKVQDLLVSVLSVAVCDPGIPAGHKNKTCLGELLSNVKINRGNVSEILRIYVEAHCEQTELAALAASLRTKAFQAHTPCQKVSMLVFLVNELCCSKAVISEIDKNIDHMSNLRKDKWVVDGELRKLRSIHTKKTGKRHSNVGGEDNLTFVIPNAKNKCKQKEGDSEEEEDEDDDTEDQGDDEDEEEEDSGGKKGKKAEICEEEDDSVHSDIDELEKQIEKTYKQQSHIRQQLFKSSYSLRSMIIGQDRYKRSYWLLPQCGIFVEGMESSEGCEVLETEKERQETVQVIRVKEEQLEETTMPAVSSLPLSAGGDTATVKSQQDKDSHNLFLQNPGSLSKLSKLLEVAKLAQDSNVNSDNSQNCHSVKIPTTAFYPSIPISQTGISHSPLPGNAHQRLGDKMDTVTSPLCAPQLQSSPWITCSPQPVLQHDQDSFLQLSKIVMDKSSQWFTLLPRSPCDDCSVTSGSSPTASSSSPQTTSTKSPSSLSPNPPATASHNTAAQINNRHSPVFQQEKSGSDQSRLTLSDVSSATMSPSLPFSGTSLPPVLDQASQHAESNGNGVNNNTVNKSETPEALSDKCPSASSPAVDVAKTQDYPRPQPIPEEMLRGWWRVSDTQELHSLVKALHSRGIREKVLQKQIQKHMEYVIQLCASSKVIDVSELEKLQGCEEMVESWNVEEQAMDVDICLLQQVEDLERRVVSAGLQVKGWTHPERHSDREDLVYHEHTLVSSPAPDSKGWKETNPEKHPDAVVRQPDNPLDIAVMRLAELEKNIEQSSDEKKADPGMRLWHEALSQVRSSAQLSLCIQQLQKSIAWERSIMKVHCHHCQKGDNEELLLLCDGCDKGCHTYCHKPKISKVPDGDWFCPTCVSKESGQSPQITKKRNPTASGAKKGSEIKQNGKSSVVGELVKEEASSSSSMSKKGTRELKKRNSEDNPSSSSQANHDSVAPCAKKAKTAVDDATGLAKCSELLAELEAHQDAWPFLTPVNHKAVPGYKKVIKRPMDFSTVREKLQNNQYSSLDPFIVDMNLVFDNCEKFNEDDSEIGQAGHSMRRFFDKRWTELLM